ncbi:3-keto-disaccharide hydrolase [Lignipirellula cremea]|uniref:3-keto-alpha-glucoside-1,2-lyase/3-keto-2-hydroxy-glucal hydratase domain-containing protein n=1 Tax=Lignipirellula cremea TaxID=2528010 RepID=A0A518DUE5_9BACT|nr:DUF1080 domain-containing protein [Lignipirellula cremea]QDU95461.1 hypothetical protein Pla8534_32760 [Lignipirellula cremea]
MKFENQSFMAIAGRPMLMLILALGAGVAGAEEKFTDLLPGEELATHWETAGNWSLDKQGVVSLTPRDGEKGWSRFDAYLWSKEQYRDFQIEFDYAVQPSGNSGFYFHVGDKAKPVSDGIEVQIYESHAKGPGKKLTDHDSGGVIPGIPPTSNAAKPAGEWNHFDITVQGKTLTIKLNNETVNVVQLGEGRLAGRPETGWIGFQDHGLPLRLRKIRIRNLQGE